MIYFDIDGVVRNFWGKHLKQPPTHWDDFPENFFEKVNANKEEYFLNAPTFENVVRLVNRLPEHINITFLTNQGGDEEKEYFTVEFLKKYITKNHQVEFVKNFDEKVERIKSVKLIDDYPFFYQNSNFSNVRDNLILMCREWNVGERKHYRYLLNPKTLTIIDKDSGLEEDLETFILTM